MALNAITDRIISDAKQEADSIIAKAKHKADEIIIAAQGKAQALKAASFENSQKEAALLSQRIISSAELDAKKDALVKKQRLVDSCFDSAVKTIVNMPDSEYNALIKKIADTVMDGESMELVNVPKEQGGGFLLKKDRVTLNYSFAELSKSMREKLEPQVIKILGW